MAQQFLKLLRRRSRSASRTMRSVFSSPKANWTRGGRAQGRNAASIARLRHALPRPCPPGRTKAATSTSSAVR